MAGLQHHQKPQHKNLGSRPGTPPELLSSTAVREHCHNLPQPYRILSLPKPPKLHTWTGITQNSMAGPRHLQSGALPKLPPTPQTRMKAPTKTSQSQTTTGITQSPGQDHGITKISNLHPGRTGHCQNSCNPTSGPEQYLNLPTLHVRTVASLKHPSPKPGLA